MRVCLDTNVLASGFATRGLCADVVREVSTTHELVTGPPIVLELQRVLTSKFGLRAAQIAEIISFLRKDTLIGATEPLPEIALGDLDDLPVLACALNADARMFVTGDKELLALRQIKGMSIVSPREFWEELKKT